MVFFSLEIPHLLNHYVHLEILNVLITVLNLLHATGVSRSFLGLFHFPLKMLLLSLPSCLSKNCCELDAVEDPDLFSSTVMGFLPAGS